VMVQAIGLTKIYGDGEEVRALDGVDLTIPAGEFLTVMGPSGSGKSTLLNMLGALDQPTAGAVFVQGQDLAKIRNVDSFRARTVGFIFQLHNLLPALTARENVEIPMQGQSFGEKERSERALHLLQLVGLADRANYVPGQLSGGQRQRVAVARALANDPALVLADEPTGSLDTDSSNEIMELLADINLNLGRTILVVSHDPKVARRTGRILTMADGKIVDDHQVGSVLSEDLRELAHSQLGELLVAPTRTSLVTLTEIGLAADGHLTPFAEQLRRLLKQSG
jgi:ABC-type lipoprotein export system ATPase subunit